MKNLAMEAGGRGGEGTGELTPRPAPKRNCRSPFDHGRLRDLRSGQAFDFVWRKTCRVLDQGPHGGTVDAFPVRRGVSQLCSSDGCPGALPLPIAQSSDLCSQTPDPDHCCCCICCMSTKGSGGSGGCAARSTRTLQSSGIGSLRSRAGGSALASTCTAT